MCGGSPGDGGAADRERERQARISRATLAVNSLFGKGDGQAAIDDAKGRVTSSEQMMTSPGVVGRVLGQVANQSASADLANATEYAPINEQAKTSREAMYSTVRDDTRNFFTRQLEQDKAEAARQRKFALARSGGFGGSQAIDTQREYQNALDRGLLEVANRADSASTGLRTADEQTRLGLIDRIVSGVDLGSAMTSAISQLSTNADRANQQATSDRMGNVFSELVNSWNRDQFNQGGASARNRYSQQFGNVFPNESTYGGTVSKGY